MANLNYSNKLISLEEALKLIKSNDNIIVGMAAAEARSILLNLHTIGEQVKNVRLSTCLNMTEATYFSDPKYKDSFISEPLFYTGHFRQHDYIGNISYIPQHLHRVASCKKKSNSPNVFIACASMPDKHGYMSMLSATYEKELMQCCDRVIIEINPNCPRTFGENTIHIDDVTHLVEVDYAMPILGDSLITSIDEKIADFIADLIEDESCLQLGIGGTPAAVASRLKNKKNLGIHTEMFTSAMVDLIDVGAINGRAKIIDNGLNICSFAVGNQQMYDYLDDNPSVQFRSSANTINPYVIGKNNKQISINSALAIDLTGQVCSESIGSRHFTGTGGQADTARGAIASSGGKSFIALNSTANLKDKATGEKKVISKIMPQLPLGSAVSLQRNDVDYVVTEYGVVNLQGKSIFDRVKDLIRIAHPDFRHRLEEEAKALKLMN